MKKILIVLFTMLTVTLFAQNKQHEETFDCLGACFHCKERIELAATNIEGCYFAEWSASMQEVYIIWNSDFCSNLDIAWAIAQVGHDNYYYPAPDSMYSWLQHYSCCQYDRTLTWNSVNEKEIEKLMVYPIPSKDFIVIDFKYENYSVYDLSGKKFNVAIVDNKLDISVLKTGTYLLVLKLENGLNNIKFVKQ